ncbi:MAG: HNH endonuclease [Chloroflexi bacterium]|nr:HNH endonuclease [Chloroflexota bacterium]
MTTHLVISREKFRKYDQLSNFISIARKGAVDGWTATRKFEVGDCVLFYFSQIMSIVAVGIVNSEPETVGGPYKWTDWQGELTVCDYKPVWLLANPIRLPEVAKEIGLLQWYRTKPYRRTHELPTDVAGKLLAEIARFNTNIDSHVRKTIVVGPAKRRSPRRALRPTQNYQEGGVKEITVELIRRNPLLRTRAIAAYGYTCIVCGFNFEQQYGDLGVGYVEVHHLRPLSARKTTHTASVNDVKVVCANCHRILHRNGRNPLPIETLREAVLKQKRRRRKAVRAG